MEIPNRCYVYSPQIRILNSDSKVQYVAHSLEFQGLEMVGGGLSFTRIKPARRCNGKGPTNWPRNASAYNEILIKVTRNGGTSPSNPVIIKRSPVVFPS